MSSSNRVRKFLVPTILIVLLAVSMFAVYLSFSTGSQTKADPNAYVGIAFGGNTTVQAKQLIEAGRKHISTQAWDDLKQINGRLWNLMPDDARETDDMRLYTGIV